MVTSPLLKTHDLYRQLLKLKICHPDSVESFYPRVRDRRDVQVFRCKKSGVIFLSTVRHIAEKHYVDQNGMSYWNSTTRQEALRVTQEDDQRRAAQFKALIKNKRWLDFGTGAGGLLDCLRDQAAEIWAVELQQESVRMLRERNYRVFQDLRSIKKNHLDVVTLFHVFEHLATPIDWARRIRDVIKPGGTLIVEVPHANDALVHLFGCESFKAFTFWSEHLILHTRESLKRFLQEAGFEDIVISGFQRYPLSNHLHWLSQGKPGGHDQWSFLNTPDLEQAYTNVLSRIDANDTLIAVAHKPQTSR